jgi:hypothetical protein
MRDPRWILVVRFMFWAMYRLNRLSGPSSTWGGAGAIEEDLLKEMELADRE